MVSLDRPKAYGPRAIELLTADAKGIHSGNPLFVALTSSLT